MEIKSGNKKKGFIKSPFLFFSSASKSLSQRRNQVRMHLILSTKPFKSLVGWLHYLPFWQVEQIESLVRKSLNLGKVMDEMFAKKDKCLSRI